MGLYFGICCLNTLNALKELLNVFVDNDYEECDLYSQETSFSL